MKKFIAVMLVFTMLFSLAACKEERKPSKLEETVPIDVEALKADWTSGELIINGKTIKKEQESDSNRSQENSFLWEEGDS